MKITFLMSATSEGFNSFKSESPSWINHGVAILGAYAKKEGYETSLIDFRRLSGWKEYIEVIKKENPNLLAMTAMTVDCSSVIKVNALSSIGDVRKSR